MNDPIITDYTEHLPQNRIGMTVREEIASRVLAGMLANGKDREHTWEGLLGAVVGYTDALIEELERTKK